MGNIMDIHLEIISKITYIIYQNIPKKTNINVVGAPKK
jgi:hypothetical protein